MKSASEMSLAIRRKKKDLEATAVSPDVVEVDDTPMSKNDADILDRDNMTTELGLDHNMSPEHSEEPTDDHERMPAPTALEYAAGGMAEEMDDAKMKRMGRLKTMMGR